MRLSGRKKSSRFAQRFFLGPPSVPPQPLRRQLPQGERGRRNRSLCGSPGNFPATAEAFTPWGEGAERSEADEGGFPDSGCFPAPSSVCSLWSHPPSPDRGKAFARPHTLHLSRKLCRPAKGSPFGGAAERSEAERASPLPVKPRRVRQAFAGKQISVAAQKTSRLRDADRTRGINNPWARSRPPACGSPPCPRGSGAARAGTCTPRAGRTPAAPRGRAGAAL